MRDVGYRSVWVEGFASLLKVFFGVCGLALGILACVMILGSAGSQGGKTEQSTEVSVLFDAKGSRGPLAKDSDLILQINLHGVLGAGALSSERIEEVLRESQGIALEEGRVKAVLLSINSPGGSAFASDEVYRLLDKYKTSYGVPMYAFVDGMCASGGYYAACAADKILSSHVTLVGSVGVLMPTIFKVDKLLEKYDIETYTFTKGEDKDSLNPFREWNEEEKKSTEFILDSMYNTFVDVVTSNRPGVSRQDLVETLGARVFPTQAALDYQLIDQGFVSREQALDDLAQKAGLKDYQVVALNHKVSLADIFREELPFKHGAWQHKIHIGNMHDKFHGQPMFLYSP